jgi:hypothetical protein
MNTLSYAAGSLFLEGLAGTGKTAALADYIKSLITQGLDPQTVLLLVPHRNARLPALFDDQNRPHIYTYPALVHLLVEQFWPLIVHQLASTTSSAPRFLSLEGSYYYINQLLDTSGAELLATVHLPRIHIVQQIWNLINQSAHAGLSLQHAQERLENGINVRNYHRTAFDVARRYRELCHQQGFVDQAEQVELFTTTLLDADAFQSYFRQVITCVAADNIEEMTGAAHDFLFWCMENTESSVLVSDWDAGFRTVLGADAPNAAQLGLLCHRRVTWSENPARSPALRHLDFQLQAATGSPEQTPLITVDISIAINLEITKFYQGMIDTTVEHIRKLRFAENVPPNLIAVVVPYLGDALRLALASRLDKLNIPHYEYRPSRALADEPLIQAVLTLMRLWAGDNASNAEVANMFSVLLPRTDRIRATLLSKAAYVKGDWIPFETLSEPMRKRISPETGTAYEALRQWYAGQIGNTQMPDEFIAAFAQQFSSAVVNGESLEVLRQRIEAFLNTFTPEATNRHALVRECIKLVENGFIGSHAAYDAPVAEQAILISPAHTFLSLDKSVDYQFWLDVSSAGWSERMNQVLTNPYVLRRSFPPESCWTEELEETAERELLRSLSLGLLRRCRKKIFAFASTTGLAGVEQRGPLLQILQRVLAPAYE